MLFLGLISSDESLCHAISEQLKQSEVWQSAHFASVEEALSAWSGAMPPLILWDAQDAPITQEMAEYFIERLRLARPSPLLVVVGEAPDPVQAFGVTEALERPLRLGHILARLQFYQRLLDQSPDIDIKLGPWLFAPRARVLTRQDGEETLKLTDKEAALLEYLADAAAPIARDELLAAIWGYDARIDTHTLETHIYRLRRKLMGNEAEGVDPFITEAGAYQMNPLWRER